MSLTSSQEQGTQYTSCEGQVSKGEIWRAFQSARDVHSNPRVTCIPIRARRAFQSARDVQVKSTQLPTRIELVTPGLRDH